MGVAGQALRERKKAETRAALRSAATRLFLERGPSAVTVHDICAAAHVSPRTFFNYFDSKEEALLTWDQHLTDELITGLATQPARTPLAALRRAMERILPSFTASTDWQACSRLFDAYPELRTKAVYGTVRNETRLVAAFAERFGHPASALYPRLLASATMAALRAAVYTWDPETGTAGLRTLVNEAFDQLEAGLPNPSVTE